MANNIINPDQTFRDSTGAVRALGTITFYENNGTTKATVYSDNDLTVSQANPYTLDAYGRILGDVHYTGLLTLSIANEDGSDVFTRDNVASSNDTLDEWINPLAATRTSTTTFTVAGDQTAIFKKDRRIKATGGADRYATVSADAVFTTLTTVTVKDTYDSQYPTFTGSTLHASMDTVYVNITPSIYVDLLDSSQTVKGDALINCKTTDTGAVEFLLHTYHENNKINVVTYFGLATGNTSAQNKTILDAALLIGKELYIPPGTYLVDDVRYTVAGKISGAGIGMTTLKLGDSAQNPLIQNTGTPSYFTIENMSLDGNKANNTPYTGASGTLRIAGADRIYINNVRIHDAADIAILVRSASEHIFANNFIVEDAALQGIAVTDGIDVHLTNGYISAPANAGIDLEPNNDTDTLDGIFIDNVKILNAGSFGIASSLGSLTAKTSTFQGIHVSNVDVENPGTSGIYLTDVDNITISDSTVTDAGAHGILAGALTYATDGIAIDNVAIDLSQSNGMQIVAGSGKVCSGVVINNASIRDSNQSASVFSNISIGSYVEDYVISGMHLNGFGAGGKNYNFGGTSIGNPIISMGNQGVGPSVASATTVTLVDPHDTFHLTGAAASFQTLNGGWKGREITFIFDSTAIMKDGVSNLKMAGDLNGTADDTITLVYDGTSWYEKTRSVN